MNTLEPTTILKTLPMKPEPRSTNKSLNTNMPAASLSNQKCHTIKSSAILLPRKAVIKPKDLITQKYHHISYTI